MKLASARRIVIELTPTLVTFTDLDGDRFTLYPVVYVEPGSGRGKILAVGEPGPADRASIRIEAFGPEQSLPAGLSRLDALVAFFRTGLGHIVRRSLLPLKPEVAIRQSGWPAHSLASIDRETITAALHRAGARAVRWTDEG